MRDSTRLRSLDAFRGIAIAAMIIVNGPTSPEHAYTALLHAAWNGWTLADTVFPAFLFMVGVSVRLSMAQRLGRGMPRAALVGHALKRTVLLFGSGLFIDNLVFPHRQFPYFTFLDHLVIPGVLQKIAVCYLAALLIYVWAGWRGALMAIVGLSVFYLGLLYLYPVPGCGAGVLTPECSFPGFLTRLVLDGYTSGAPYEPDGLGVWMPAVTSVLFGILAGEMLQMESRYRARIMLLIAYGVGLIVVGTLLSSYVPINKPLWTPSYATLMAGIAATTLAAMYWLVDVRHATRLLAPFEIMGMNATAAYLASRPVDHALRVHFAGHSIPDILLRSASPEVASFLFGIVVVFAVFAGTLVMYRRQLFLKF